MNASALLPLALALAAGVCVALQAGSNAGLRQHLGLWPALLVNSVIVLVLVAAGMLAMRSKLPDGASLRTAPWSCYLGGFCGFVIIAAMAWVVPKIGTAQAMVLLVCAQGVTALVMDHFGWFGNPQISASPLRIAGVFCLIGGVFLLRWGSSPS